MKTTLTDAEVRAFLPDEARAAVALGTPDEVALIVRVSSHKAGRMFLGRRIRPRNGHPITYQLDRKLEDVALSIEPRAWTAASFCGVPCIRLPSLILCRAAVVSARGRLIAHPHIRGPLMPQQGTPLTDEQAERWEDYVTEWPWTIQRDGYKHVSRYVSETIVTAHRA